MTDGKSQFISGLLFNAGNNETPFWLMTNRGGMMPINSGANTLFYQAYHTSLTEQESSWDIRAGGSFFANYNDVDSRLGINSFYGHVRRYGLRLSAGRYYEEIGFGAPYLSTGKMMVSSNARVPWRIGVYTDGYIDVPRTSGIISFKGRWSEGIFLDERYIDGANLHQKNLYVRIKPIKQLSVEAGLVHNLIWGGRHPERGLMHHNFQDYLDDVLGRADAPSVTPLGNGVISYDFGLRYKPESRDFSIGLGRLFYIESKANLRFRSPWDGMWSAWVEFQQADNPRLLDYVVYEHLNTRRQDALEADLPGRGRIYTHDTWRDGWVHHGQVMGNALLTLEPDLLNTGERTVINNIVLAHHLAAKGWLNRRWQWEAAITYSRNYGDCSDQIPGIRSCHGRNGVMLRENEDRIPLSELRKDRYSAYLSNSYALFPQRSGSNADFRLRISLAYDTGSFYDEHRIGAEIGFLSFF